MLRLDSSSSPDTSLVFLSSGNNETPSPPLQEPLSSALKEVFKALSVISERTAYVSQQTHFVFRFLEYIVRCGKDRARPVLQGMPNTLVTKIILYSFRPNTYSNFFVDKAKSKLDIGY